MSWSSWRPRAAAVPLFCVLGAALLAVQAELSRAHAQGPNCVPPESGLVCWWDLDGNALDRVGGLHGTLYGSAGYNTAKVDLGLELRTWGDRMIVSDDPSLELDELTLEAWIRIDSTLARTGIIVWKAHTGNFVESRYALTLAGPLRDKLQGTISNGSSFEWVNSTSSLTLGVFTHVAMTVDSSYVTLYIDGQQDGQIPRAVASPLYDNSAPLQVGGLQNDTHSDRRWDGFIDELALYDRALTPPEIQAIYDADSQGKCKAPMETYCSGKTNSLGCVPYLTFAGIPSASDPDPYPIRANDLLPGEVGFYIYGSKKSNLGFHGAKLCVKQPFERWFPAKVAKTTGGPPCTGWLSRDFNGRIQSGVDPTLTVGRQVNLQLWYRDPADPAGFGDGLTNGLKFTIVP